MIHCGDRNSKVVDSRAMRLGTPDNRQGVRRRRKFPTCGERFTTYEFPFETGTIALERKGDKSPPRLIRIDRIERVAFAASEEL